MIIDEENQAATWLSRDEFQSFSQNTKEHINDLQGELNKVQEKVGGLEKEMERKNKDKEKDREKEKDMQAAVAREIEEVKTDAKGNLKKVKFETEELRKELARVKEEAARERAGIRQDLEILKIQTGDAMSALKQENNQLRSTLDRVIQYLVDTHKKEETPNGPTHLSIPVMVYSEARGVAAGLHAAFPPVVAQYFRFDEIELRKGFPPDTSGVAVVTLFSPTDRWLDSIGKPLVDEFKARYKTLVLILLKPFSDVSKLKSITQNNGFDFVFQVCCSSSDLKLLVNDHNRNELLGIAQALEHLFAPNIAEVEHAKKMQAEQSKQLSALGRLLHG